MDEDTKLFLRAWRVLLVENHRLAGDCSRLQRRVVELEELLKKGNADVGKRIDHGWSDVPWRRVGIGRRGDADSSD